MGDAERAKRAETLFREALALDAEGRERLLVGAEARDPEAAREARALLAADAGGGASFLDRSPAGRTGARLGVGAGVGAGTLRDPERIGSYVVEKRLGEGGMGIVYLAQQERPRRRVAVKVIRPEMMSERAVGRFLVEAEVLGRLNHPGIASILEAGTDTSGSHPRHYLAMEFIEGETLAAYVAGQGLGVRRRMALVADLADAVHHAHQRGVIHRDLKPGNVLVTREGRPKVLDFGIARAAGSRELGPRTATGHVVGTLEYFSPEQVGPDPGAVDVRTDVYALGLIAYELVAGAPAFDFEGIAFIDALRRIRETGARPIDQVVRGCDRDVATIISRAMDLDPERRYASASELGADIRRFLAGEPIEARRASATYRLTKFASANRSLVGGVATLVLVLAGALVAVSLALGEARRQRDEKDRQIATLEGLNTFFIEDLMALADPWESGERGITLTDALDRASEGLGERLVLAPEVEATIRHALGRMYINLARLDQAEVHLERAHALAAADGAMGLEGVEIQITLAMLRMDQDRQEEALPLATGAVERARAEAPGDAGVLVDALSMRASVMYRMGDRAGAEAAFAEAYALGRDRLPGDDRTLGAGASLALIWQGTGRMGEARPLSERVVAGYRRLRGAEHPDTLTAANNLAMLYASIGERELADALHAEVLGIRRRTLGDLHTDTLVTLATYARLFRRDGEFERGESMALEAYSGLEATLGPDHEYTRVARRDLVSLYEAWARPEDAARWRGAEPGS